MKNYGDIKLLLANDRIRAEVVAAANARLARAQAEPRPSIRRSFGHQIIRIGERLAEESHFEPARSR